MAKSDSPAYVAWRGMMGRCYHASKLKLRPTYEACTVISEWHDVDRFHDWCKNQIGFGTDGWQLDKDLLVPGNTVYGPEFCRFVPNELNCLFSKGTNKMTDLPKGVSLIASTGRYRARVLASGVKILDRVFPDRDEALRHYRESKLVAVRSQIEKWKGRIAEDLHERLSTITAEDL